MIEQNARQTKVVKSFEGNALTAVEAAAVVKEEVDVIRLVYKPDAVAAIKEFMSGLGRDKNHGGVPVMLDISSWTQGVVHGLKTPREVVFGEKLDFSPPKGSATMQIACEAWAKMWAPRAKVFFGSGQVALKVAHHSADKVTLEVTQGGTIFPDAEVFIPDTRKDPERPTATVAELKPLIDAGVDYLIVPGQWTSAKLAQFKQQLAAAYGDLAPWIMAKIDSASVVDRLEELVGDVEGVLISRRELALSTNPATVPMITKEIIQLCNDRAKLVVTASEMLASMRRNVTPTRAEVSDIANAVLDGTDAVVLSEEVANGKYGHQAVQVTHRIILDIEESRKVKPNWIKTVPAVTNEMDAIAFHAYKTAERLKAKAIVCVTKAGNTALKLASFRAPIPIIAVTFSPTVMRRLAMVRGVESLMFDIDPNLDDVLPLVNDHLVRGSWLKPGDHIIFVSITISSVGRESSNLFTVQKLT